MKRVVVSTFWSFSSMNGGPSAKMLALQVALEPWLSGTWVFHLWLNMKIIWRWCSLGRDPWWWRSLELNIWDSNSIGQYFSCVTLLQDRWRFTNLAVMQTVWWLKQKCLKFTPKSWSAVCGSNCLLARAMNGCIMRHGIISSCQSAATSEIVKRFWSWVHV